MKIPTYPEHPLARLFPMGTAEEITAMAESIRKNGLREPIVLVEGAILDGRNRLAACREAGVMPTTREFGDVITDGASLAYFVSDKNLRHRHLSTSQRIAIAEEMVPFFEAENVTVTEATIIAAGTLKVSPQSVREAKNLKAKAPEKFDAVKAGTTTLNAATQQQKEEDAREKERLAELQRDDEERKIGAARKQHTAVITKSCGDTFGQAFARGSLLKTKDEFDAFVELHPEDQAMCKELIIQNWNVKQALKFLKGTMNTRHTIQQLLNFATGHTGKKPFQIAIEGMVITVRKVLEGENI